MQRFSAGVAHHLTDKMERVERIQSEKKRIRDACENYRR
jgi:uncharacterized protein (UPF0335 family)